MRNGEKDDDPNWTIECERIFLDEGRITFDLFAPKALELLTGSEALRKLVAERYPLIVVDEAQDTGASQWACIELLAPLTQILCLADLDQQIYDWRPDVDAERVNQIMAVLDPLEVDLGIQNNRSPSVEIVQFGNDILSGTPRRSTYSGVSQLQFKPNADLRDKAIRSAYGMIVKKVTDATGKPPKNIAYLTSWGKGVTIIARALQGGDGIKEIRHCVIMDETAVLLATRVTALCLEPVDNVWNSLATGLKLLSDLYRGLGNVAKANQLTRNALDAQVQRTRGSAKCPPALKGILEQLKREGLIGDPGQDWLTVRKLFERSNVAELKYVANQVLYLMAFNRGRRISDALAETWLRNGHYCGARSIIERAITKDQIVGGGNDLEGINVMTTHKSKGKEFDGVIMLHLGNNVSPYSSSRDEAPYLKSRRLLRVGITRAKHHVLMLTDVYSPSQLLNGHRL